MKTSTVLLRGAPMHQPGGPTTKSAMHTIANAIRAAAFIFVPNFLIFGTNLQTALIWAIGFARFAFVLARQRIQR